MGLSRRFLNLIVASRMPGVKSLRRIDMARQLFYSDTQQSRVAQDQEATSRPSPLKMESIRLPKPTFSFRASAPYQRDQWKIDCFPFVDCKVICSDQSGRAFLFEADTRHAKTMPTLHQTRRMPISLFVPNADVDDDEDNMGFGSSIFFMDRILKPEAGNDQRINHFEAFIYRRPSANFYFKSWHCHRLPLPPHIHEAQTSHEISSYGVVHDDSGSHICISIDGVGTYCFHAMNHTWEKVGEWTLPFRGKLEYVPELKLWFGLSARDQHLAAADLSAMSSRPQIVDAWKELEPPDEWKECSDSQLVNLGSGRFCIARFFQAAATIDADFGNKVIDKSFAVLTGVEVNSTGNSKAGRGKVKLQMTPHKSRLINNTSIEALF